MTTLWGLVTNDAAQMAGMIALAYVTGTGSRDLIPHLFIAYGRSGVPDWIMLVVDLVLVCLLWVVWFALP